MQQWRLALGMKNTKIGFVPTLGALHKGHVQLLKQARKDNEYVILSLFLNPYQFDEHEDYAQYPKPRTLDLKLAQQGGADLVFIPSLHQMYPDDFRYKVTEAPLSQQLEGACRHQHFDGVLTVVLKLLILIQPDHLYLGEKDYQQYLLVKGLVSAFLLNTQVMLCETVRESNGLAYSSRNQALTPLQRAQAAQFIQILRSKVPKEQTLQALTQAGFKVDYVEDINGRRLGAVRIGKVRLIDNCLLGS